MSNQSFRDQGPSIESVGPDEAADRLARRRLIKRLIATVPAILTLTAGPAGAQGGPSNQPSPTCASLPPTDPGYCGP